MSKNFENGGEPPYEIEVLSSPDREDLRARREAGGFRRGAGMVLRKILAGLFYLGVFALLVGALAAGKLDPARLLGKPGGSGFAQLAEAGFPSARENPRQVVYRWTYAGREYSLPVTLYGNVATYYKSSPVKALYEGDAEDGYYQNFSRNLEHEQDGTIRKLAQDLRAAGKENGLSEDKIVELMVAFVQAIPYDQEKYALIQDAAHRAEDTWPRFPYEVLYDNQGICSDKSLLTVALADALDYGTALFAFDSQEHMVPAIRCTPEYSSFSSGYCYTEVTSSGFRIGDSSIDQLQAGQARIRGAISHAEEDISAPAPSGLLTGYHVYARQEGKTYAGIIETVATLQRITALRARIAETAAAAAELKRDYKQEESAAEAYEREAEQAYRNHASMRDTASYARYTQAFNQYSAAYAGYLEKVELFNAKIDEYNRLVDEYNDLVESFYG